MSNLYVTYPGLRAEQKQACDDAMEKYESLVNTLGRAFWLAGHFAGAEYDAMKGVLDGDICMGFAKINAIESEVQGMLVDPWEDQSDPARFWRRVYELIAEAMVLHIEAYFAQCEFVRALQTELSYRRNGRNTKR